MEGIATIIDKEITGALTALSKTKTEEAEEGGADSEETGEGDEEE